MRRTQRFWRRQLGPLRVLGSYRHLGCRVDCTRTQNAELAARRSSAQAAAVALGHSVLKDRAIPTKVRTCVARSTIHSRLLHQAGKWTCLSKTQLHHLHTRYMAPLRRILGKHKPPEPGTHRMRDNEILRLTSCGWQLKSRHRSKRCP